MSRCGTFAICECGHLLAAHDLVIPPTPAGRFAGGHVPRALLRMQGGFRLRDDAAHERAAYERAMRGEL